MQLACRCRSCWKRITLDVDNDAGLLWAECPKCESALTLCLIDGKLRAAFIGYLSVEHVPDPPRPKKPKKRKAKP